MIVAGFGFRSRADVASLMDAFTQASAGHAVTALSTAADKVNTQAFVDLARSLRLPIVGVDAADLATTNTPTQSVPSQVARDTGSVAEAAALSAAGPGAILLQSRAISADRCATCALAQSGQKGHLP